MVATITYFEQIRERFYTPFFYGLFCAILYKTNKIKYNSKIYTVERRIGDSIFCRIDKDKIIVFVEKENLD